MQPLPKCRNFRIWNKCLCDDIKSRSIRTGTAYSFRNWPAQVENFFWGPVHKFTWATWQRRDCCSLRAFISWRAQKKSGGFFNIQFGGLLGAQCDQPASWDAFFSKNSNSEKIKSIQVSAKDAFFHLIGDFQKHPKVFTYLIKEHLDIKKASQNFEKLATLLGAACSMAGIWLTAEAGSDQRLVLERSTFKPRSVSQYGKGTASGIDCHCAAA